MEVPQQMADGVAHPPRSLKTRGRFEAAKSVKRYAQKREATQEESWINKILDRGHWDGRF